MLVDDEPQSITRIQKFQFRALEMATADNVEVPAYPKEIHTILDLLWIGHNHRFGRAPRHP